MTWLAWRQFRAQAAVAALATVAVVAVFVATRDHVARAPDPGQLSTVYQSLRLFGTGLVGIPAFIGAFWGAPLVARELEAGTHRLVWTQSVTRARWLAVKLGVLGLVTIATTAILTSVFTWWSIPFDRLGNRIGTANFGQRGITPIAYALFALVLGALLGAMLRRTLPAMALTLVAFFIVRFNVQLFVRPHLGKVLSVSRAQSLFGPSPGQSSATGGWIVSTKIVDAAGHAMSPAAVENAVSTACARGGRPSPEQLSSCADRLGIHEVVKFHPADGFWALQAWEAALFLGLTLVLVAVALWWIRRKA